MPVFSPRNLPSVLKGTSSKPGYNGFQGPELHVRTPEIGWMVPQKGHESFEHICKPV